MCTWCCGGIVYIQTVQCGGQTEPCGTAACISLGANISPSTQTLNFPYKGKQFISLIMLVEKFNFDNLYSRAKCHLVSKAFSISKNTAVVDKLSLKFWIMGSVSLIY
jgi:hypothetical protein